MINRFSLSQSLPLGFEVTSREGCRTAGEYPCIGQMAIYSTQHVSSKPCHVGGKEITGPRTEQGISSLIVLLYLLLWRCHIPAIPVRYAQDHVHVVFHSWAALPAPRGYASAGFCRHFKGHGDKEHISHPYYLEKQDVGEFFLGQDEILQRTTHDPLMPLAGAGEDPPR